MDLAMDWTWRGEGEGGVQDDLRFLVYKIGWWHLSWRRTMVGRQVLGGWPQEFGLRCDCAYFLGLMERTLLMKYLGLFREAFVVRFKDELRYPLPHLPCILLDPCEK